MNSNAPPRRSIARNLVWLMVVALLCYALVPLFLTLAPAPLIDSARIVGTDIYKAVDRSRKIPTEVALPHIARVGIAQFIKLLPLEDAVRERVQSRLQGTDFVDELVPFLLMIKEMYVPGDELGMTKFDDYLRSNFTPEQNLPGMEHSMFSFVPDAQVEAQTATAQGESSTAGFGLTLDLAGELVTLYDALYLHENTTAQGVFDRLACSADEIAQRLPATAARVQPIVRSVLGQVRAGMAPETELGHSLDSVLADDERLQTITLSLVHFMDLMVCKHYRMFAGRVSRETQLAKWLNAELSKDAAGQLWSYLDQAQNRRRFGVMVAVDGLQGHLMEALAKNNYNGAFVQTMATEQRLGMDRVTPENEQKLAQQTRFLEHFADQGFARTDYLPFFRDLYSFSGASDTIHPHGVARAGISTTPTISVRNLPIIKTGAPVAGEGGTGVPNFHFVDRDFELAGVQQGRAYYFFGNDALQLTALTDAAGMQSLFQRLPEVSSYSCTAQYDDFADAGIDPFLNLALGEALRDFGEVLCFKQLTERADNEVALQSLRTELLTLRERLGFAVPWYNWYRQWDQRTARARAVQLIEQIAKRESLGMPELLLYYNPWPDHFAHFTGPFADEILSPSGELARLDYWLSQLREIYVRAGIVERTLFGMAGDHGLSPVFELVSPQEVVLTALEREGVPLEIIKISSDEGEGPKLTNVLSPPSMRGYDVVIASTAGGNLMFDFFIDQHERWAQQPVETDLRAWQPIAWQAGGEAEQDGTIDLIHEMLTRLGDSLEYLVVRKGQKNDAQQTSIAVYAHAGQAVVQRRGEQIYYAFERQDPLKLDQLSRYQSFTDQDVQAHQVLYTSCVRAAIAEDMTTWCSETQWRELAAYTSKPDSVVQLAHLYDSDRAGTINLFPVDGVAYNSIVPGRHAGESFHEKDAFAGLWGAPIPAQVSEERLGSVLGGSIPMAIYEFLTERQVTEDESGWGYPSLWQDLYDTTQEDE